MLCICLFHEVLSEGNALHIVTESISIVYWFQFTVHAYTYNPNWRMSVLLTQSSNLYVSKFSIHRIFAHQLKCEIQSKLKCGKLTLVNTVSIHIKLS